MPGRLRLECVADFTGIGTETYKSNDNKINKMAFCQLSQQKFANKRNFCNTFVEKIRKSVISQVTLTKNKLKEIIQCEASA